MGAINWDFAVKGTPVNPANFMVAAIYAASAPATLVQSVQLTKPYTGTSVGTFLGIDPIVYNFILWESVDATPAGTVLVPIFKFEPATVNSLTFRDNLDLIADTTPGFVSGTTGYVDPGNTLVGWKYTVFEIGDGPKLQIDVSYDGNNNWSLTDGEILQPDQRFVMIFQPQGALTQTLSASLISSGRLITDNQTLTSTDLNKAILLQGTAASMIEILPALSTVADFQRIIIYSQGGSHINASIRAAGSDQIQRNTLVSKIVLGQNSKLEMFKYLGKWQVDFVSPDVDQVLQLMETMYATELNSHPFDGTLSLRATYERVWDKAQLIGNFVSETNWLLIVGGKYVNKGFFTAGTDTSNFRWPDLRVHGYRVASGGIPGSYNSMNVGTHDHVMHGKGTIIGTGGPYYLAGPGAASTRYSAGGGSDQFGGKTSTPDATMRTGDNAGTGLNTPDSTNIFLLARI